MKTKLAMTDIEKVLLEGKLDPKEVLYLLESQVNARKYIAETKKENDIESLTKETPKLISGVSDIEIATFSKKK